MVPQTDFSQDRRFSRAWIRQAHNTHKKTEQQSPQDNGYTDTIMYLLPVSFVGVQHIVLIA